MAFTFLLDIFRLCIRRRSLWVQTMLFDKRILGCDKWDVGNETMDDLLQVKRLQQTSPEPLETFTYSIKEQRSSMILYSGKSVCWTCDGQGARKPQCSRAEMNQHSLLHISSMHLHTVLVPSNVTQVTSMRFNTCLKQVSAYLQGNSGWKGGLKVV